MEMDRVEEFRQKNSQRLDRSSAEPISEYSPGRERERGMEKGRAVGGREEREEGNEGSGGERGREGMRDRGVREGGRE